MHEINVFKPEPPVSARVDEKMDGEVAVSTWFDSSLTGHIKNCFNAARYAKQSITERLLKCERQRRGVYDPDRAAQIAETGGTDIYMMVTDIKCRAAASWIRDVMANVQGRPFDLEPAKVPDLPPEIGASIADLVMVEAQELMAQGQQIHPEAFRLRLQEVHDQIRMRLKEEAKQASERMSDVIEDQLKEGNWNVALQEFIDDYVTYPAAIMKAPVVRRKSKLMWGEGYVPIVVSDFSRDVQRVSPYDAYPSPNSSGPNSGFFIERHRLHRSDYHAMLGTPGYSDRALKAVIDHYGQSGLRYYETGDSEEEALKSGHTTFNTTSDVIEALEYWGKVNGKMLNEWGMRGMDPYADYEVNAWLVGSYVIRCVLNPDPLGRRPYHTASWGRIPGSFWGVSLPEIVRDVQIMCNAAARSLANNMAIASGPQVEVQVDRLPEGEEVTKMYPWKMWQTTSDRTGSGQPAIRFFQPAMNAQELLQIYTQFARQADEVTGIPNYVYGSTQTGGAGRTASGLSMLMDNAAKGIKMAVVTIDEVIVGVTEKYYTHNMMYSADPYIKGDFRIKARGALGLIAKEQLQQRRAEFLQATANPVDMEIIGLEGRAYMLKEMAHGLNMNTDKIVPENKKQGGIPPEMQAQMAQQEQQAAEIMQQAQQALAQKDEELAQIQALVAQLQMQVKDKSGEIEVDRAKVDADRYSADVRAEADRYEADKRAEAEKYRADKEAESRMAERAQGEREPRTEQAPQIVVNSDTVPIAEAIKSSGESTSMAIAEMARSLNMTSEAFARVMEKALVSKNAKITLTKKADGSIEGSKTEG